MVDVKKIGYVGHNRPNCSCGTGYSETDVFVLTYVDGFKEKKIIDLWYQTPDSIKKAFYEECRINVSNIDEAYEMFVDVLVQNKVCPYTREELIKARYTRPKPMSDTMVLEKDVLSNRTEPNND